MVLVYGGSFNPPTIAHEAIIHKLYEEFKPRKILIVPTGNYFSWKTDLIDFEHRFKMLELMTQNLDYVEISRLEDTKEFLGSYHTLNELNKQYDDLYFVVGADHIKTLDHWKDYKLLIQNYKFILITRNNYSFDDKLISKLGLKYKKMMFQSDISSSEIRQNLNQNLDKLKSNVKTYILENKLYEEVKVWHNMVY